jgi:hypothetical protein
MALAWVPFLPSLFWDRVAPRWNPPGQDARSARGAKAGIVRGVIVLLLLSLAIIDNVVSLDRTRFHGVPWTILRIPTRALALSQEWRLWSTPLRNRYYVFRACLEDRSEVDLHTGEALDWDRPRRASRNNHWWKYQQMFSRPAGRRLRPAYAELQIREWNDEHAAARQVAALELVKIDAAHPHERIFRLPREVLWRGGPRPNACAS